MWIPSPIYHFSLLTEVNLGMERAQSHLMLKLSLDTLAVRLEILANLCPSVFGHQISVLISSASSQIGKINCSPQLFSF